MSDEPKMIDLAEHFAKVKSFHVEGPGIEPHVIWATQMEDPQAEMIPIEVEEPRIIWADVDQHDFESEKPSNTEGFSVYYHADVVQELREKLGALERLCSGVAAKAGPQHAWWDDIFDARALLKDS